MGDRLLLDPELAPALREAGLTSVDRVFGLEGEPAESRDGTWIEHPVAGTSGRFYLKRYRHAGWSRSIHLAGRGTMFGLPPEIRTFRNLEWLRANALPAVRPILGASRTRCGMLTKQALMTEFVPGALDLATRLATPDDPVRTEAGTRRRVLRAIARRLREMHARGFVHRDLHARNVLVRDDREDVGIWLLDCRRGGRSMSRKAHLLDLATLDVDLARTVPTSNRLRGLLTWLGEEKSVRPTLRRVDRLAERVRRREEKRQRRRDARVARR